MTSARASAASLSAPSGPRRRLVRALGFPLARIVLAVIVVSIAMNATRALLKYTGLSAERGAPHRLALLLLGTVATIVVVHAAYLAYVHYIEGRAASEFAATGAVVSHGPRKAVNAGSENCPLGWPQRVVRAPS